MSCEPSSDCPKTTASTFEPDLYSAYVSLVKEKAYNLVVTVEYFDTSVSFRVQASPSNIYNGEPTCSLKRGSAASEASDGVGASSQQGTLAASPALPEGGPAVLTNSTALAGAEPAAAAAAGVVTPATNGAANSWNIKLAEAYRKGLEKAQPQLVCEPSFKQSGALKVCPDLSYKHNAGTAKKKNMVDKLDTWGERPFSGPPKDISEAWATTWFSMPTASQNVQTVESMNSMGFHELLVIMRAAVLGNSTLGTVAGLKAFLRIPDKGNGPAGATVCGSPAFDWTTISATVFPTGYQYDYYQLFIKSKLKTSGFRNDVFARIGDLTRTGGASFTTVNNKDRFGNMKKNVRTIDFIDWLQKPTTRAKLCCSKVTNVGIEYEDGPILQVRPLCLWHEHH